MYLNQIEWFIFRHQQHIQQNINHLTDDASVAENLGLEINLIEGDYQNIKITTPEDLMIAKAFLEMIKTFN
jgi:2-C-methyl-D-erythritol 4-phosphate cytidylyltransferase